MLVVRPADSNETTVAWKMALENTKTPTGMIFSRQNISNLPESTYEKALAAEKGAYIVEKDSEQPDVVLLASGSEVGTLVEGAKLLRERKGLKIQIVSVISEGLFRNQEAAYQECVLPAATPRFGMTAGLSVTLEGLVGFNGKVWGLNHFGYSAPYTVLDEKFGFTGENVFNQVVEFLG